MKARTLVLMLCISLMCFTGFGNTTTDLTENSQPEFVQLDHSVTAVAVVDVSIENSIFVVNDSESIQAHIFKDAAMVSGFSVSQTDAHANLPTRKLANKAADSNATRNPFNPLLDVGWCNYQNQLITPDELKDPGGVLSIFYI